MIKVLELFGGIGSPRKALERLGIEHEVVDYVEIDKYAVKSYNAMYGTNFEPQDITQWDKDIEVDLVIGGSPCQDFSLAGKQAGGDEGTGTRSSLMYETIRIVEKLKPKFVIWENVKNLLSVKHRHNFDAYLEIMENLGYENHYQVLNAKDYGIPQNRERVFTISILGEQDFIFPTKQELKLKLKDMLEDEVDEKYYLSEDKIHSISHWKAYQKPFEKVQGKNSIVPTLTARGAGAEHSGMITYSDRLEETTNLQEECLHIKNATKKGYKEAYDGDSYVSKKYSDLEKENGYIPELFNPYNKKEITDIAPTQTTQCGSTASSATVLLKDNLRIRKLTPKECFRLMGFDDEDFEKVSQVNSNAQLYKQAGNSIVVQVLEAIFRELLGYELCIRKI